MLEKMPAIFIWAQSKADLGGTIKIKPLITFCGY